jgi:hypothetical protein
MAQYQLVHAPQPATYGHSQKRRAPTAADIAAQLAIDAWSRILGLIADGVPSYKAIETVGATRALVEGMLRGRPEYRRQWEDAKIAALRRAWDADILTDICNDIAAGLSVQKACLARGRQAAMFVKIVLSDPLLREEYDAARKIRAELWADEQIEIADEDYNDMDLTGKGNTAAVARSKLKVETRQHLAGKFNREKFGEDKQKPQDINVNVNVNAAERLEQARARRLAMTIQPVTDAEVVEGEGPTAGNRPPATSPLSATSTPSSSAAGKRHVLGAGAGPRNPATTAADDRSWLEG